MNTSWYFIVLLLLSDWMESILFFSKMAFVLGYYNIPNCVFTIYAYTVLCGVTAICIDYRPRLTIALTV